MYCIQKFGAERLTGALAALVLLVAAATAEAQHAYAGFDRNVYPGDAELPALRKSFQYSSFWLNNPPGEKKNGWTGKRAALKERGFGFLVLFNGRIYAELKDKDASALGTADGKAAVAAAAREGFPKSVIIFLDQEEGGRLVAEQAAYLFAWVDGVRAGGARAGVYCSGIDVPGGGGSINTARDIVDREKARGKSAERIKLWIVNDQCPPSPGCTLDLPRLSNAVTPGVEGSVVVWQYAVSPRRSEFSAHCPQNQAQDRMCYAPGLANSAVAFVDLNTADSADPSEGR